MHRDSIVLAPGARVVVTGPRATDRDLATLAAIARTARLRGMTVLSAIDLARAAGTRDWDSAEYARAKAEALADADVVIFAPGWEKDTHACITREMVGLMGIPAVDWVIAIAAA